MYTIPMTNGEKLTHLQIGWHTRNTCPLKKFAIQPVFGEGNPEAKIVFIGEAPGKLEDIEGRPFVGSSGKFLSEMLGSIKIERESVYITNMVKYRPPNNRDPLPLEKNACKGWLIDELNFIQPKLIVFLGRHAMSNFFPEEKISEVHGKLLTKKFTNLATSHFLPLYHPASALYNGGLRTTLKKDFRKIPALLKKIKGTTLS